MVVFVAAEMGCGTGFANILRPCDANGYCSSWSQPSRRQLSIFVFWHAGKSIFDFGLLGSNHGER